MQRSPEPELMLDPAQAQAYAQADFAEPHSRFVTLLQERLPDLPVAGRALDLGCGSGDVTRRVAEALPHWDIDAIDGSPAMLALANQLSDEHGLASRVVFHELLLPTKQIPHQEYQLVYSNSLLHHMHEPRDFWITICQAALPGTWVFVMDLLRPPGREVAQALVERYAADEPEVLRVDFYNSLLAAYRLPEVADQLANAGLVKLQFEEVSDRHFIVWGQPS